MKVLIFVWFGRQCFIFNECCLHRFCLHVFLCLPLHLFGHHPIFPSRQACSDHASRRPAELMRSSCNVHSWRPTRRRDERPTRPTKWPKRTSYPSHPSFKKSEAEASSAPKINLATQLIFDCERIHEWICQEGNLERLWHNAITIEVARRVENKNGALFLSHFRSLLCAVCFGCRCDARIQSLSGEFVSLRRCRKSTMKDVVVVAREGLRSLHENGLENVKMHPNDSSVRRFWTISAEIAASKAVTLHTWNDVKPR